MTSQNVNTDTFSNISIDIETFSDADLKKCGVYKYAESPNFEILLFAYSLDNGPVQVIDLAQGEEIPESILAALSDNRIEKWAYNASFERICLSEYLRKHHPEHFVSYSIDGDTVSHYLDPSAWKCSRIWGAYMGLPLSLEGIGAVLKLQDQKMKEGKDLIRYFCVPCKPTKTNGGRERNLPEHAPDKWDVFKSYNIRDVEVELAIKDKLRLFPVPDFVWDEYHLDQEINDRGIAVDMQLVDNAVNLDAMGAIEMGLEEEELQPLVDAWRNANSNITSFWWQIDSAVKQAVIQKKSCEVGFLKIYYQSGMLFIDLPSGRRLCYVKPKMGTNQFGSESVTYEGINTGKWTRIESYGPKFVENIVQAISRDILAYAMRTLAHTFIVGSVHDELIIECSPDVSVEAICEQMGRTPPWISGLLLRADGYECPFYKKD